MKGNTYEIEPGQIVQLYPSDRLGLVLRFAGTHHNGHYNMWECAFPESYELDRMIAILREEMLTPVKHINSKVVF